MAEEKKKKKEEKTETTDSSAQTDAVKKTGKSLLFDLILDTSTNVKEHSKAFEEGLRAYLAELVPNSLSDKYFVLFLWIESSISNVHRDQIYRALLKNSSDPQNKKPVLLFIQSGGGSIEPAYQIAKACHKHSKDKFIVCIPREAKSAATLIALGADEIHMGDLSQLGPIDPQINGLPALGLKDSLREIARIAGDFPNSQMMFSQYLRNQMNLAYFGWASRISDSAIQYGEKLLSLKHSGCVSFTKEEARVVADKLVNHYKDHGFVVDSDEATEIFCKPNFIKIDTDELRECEKIYDDIRFIIAGFRYVKNIKLELIGCITDCFRLEIIKDED
jgi:hypothetical protein